MAHPKHASAHRHRRARGAWARALTPTCLARARARSYAPDEAGGIANNERLESLG